MENNKNPATPPQGATPGNEGSQNRTTPPVGSSPASNNGGNGENNKEGSVTIPLKEYRALQRQDARAKSFDKRYGAGRTPAGAGTQPNDGGNQDPELLERFNKSESDRQSAEKRAMQAEVRGRVRDLLEKDDFKDLPKSTKDLILKNPALLSNADNLDEAMLDIEDFLYEQAAGVAPIPGNNNSGGNNNNVPPRNDTPPATGAGGPAPAGAGADEDTSKLSGPAKTQAMIRNSMRKNTPPQG